MSTTYRRAAALALSLAALVLAGLPSAAANAASAAPAWRLSLSSNPTNVAPGGSTSYYLFATNVGGKEASGPITLTDTLPEGLTPVSAATATTGGITAVSCEIVAQTVTCTAPGPVPPGKFLTILIGVKAGPLLADPSTRSNQATVSSVDASVAQASTTTTITSADPPFDFLPGPHGLGASLTEADGSPSTAAGSHPYQLTVDLGFPTTKAGFLTSADGGLRDLRTVLPRGLVVDPSATPVRCSEAELESGSCPDASAVGEVALLSVGGGITTFQNPLYNMVPPPGAAASLAFDAAGVGIFVHVLGGLRAGDYALAADTDDVLALFGSPVLGVQAHLWGDPSSPSHDYARGGCSPSFAGITCPVPQQSTPFLTMPTSCGDSLRMEAEADSWGHPGVFHKRSAQLTDLEGNEVGVAGCNQLDFKPTLKARPTTNVADSPSGLDVDLHVPQSDDLDTLATAHLKKAVVTLPEGLVVNPSGANGLAGCSSEQIGIDPETGIADGDKPACPDASKIGSVEVETPLLDHPLPGAVHIATPNDNPFDSLLAIYIAVEDPETGVIVKLAGHVVADPDTGRLTTTFDQNPQLPFEHFRLKFFGGATAPLRTPATCGDYSTTSVLTPWSAPDSGPPAAPSDTYPISQAPGGGSCPTGKGAQPNAPAMNAGTIAPQAGAYSPFVLNLARQDGSQEFSSLSVTAPPGLVGKLAGTPYCPDSALAAAAAKSGNEEKASPSCPPASRIGSVDVAAGAGPTPYNAGGTAYLAGPYKGAPLSLAIITPATAGPYDLGTVVVRSALKIDPATAQITAVSDPIPHILQGIPLDVRRIAVKLDRPEFTLNPTSCDPMAFGGQLLSTLGQSAALASPFQVGGCPQLPFKPKLSLALKGGTKRAAHPKLIATLKAKPGEANIASASVQLPKSAFLDQAHIRTICTRVQFAADACPKGSIYGKATAITPLLDSPLSGNVYLRSSNHKLPDLVVALKGPESLPIEIELAGKTDSVKGALRNTFEAVPDAPVSKFSLELFGGNRGLVINSRNLCAHAYRATIKLDGQNGKVFDTTPVVGSDCGKGRKGKRGHRARQ